MPRLHELHRKRHLLPFSQQCRAVQSNAGAGILGRHADRDRPLHAIRDHLLLGISNKRDPVPHSDVDRHLQLALQCLRLFDRIIPQRRAANQPIPVLDLVHNFRRQLSPPGHVAQKFRNVLHAVRAAMRQQQNRRLLRI